MTWAPEIVPHASADTHVIVIPAVDWRAYNRLAVIITRLDPNETADPLGNYQVTLEPTATAVAGGN